MDGFKVKVVNLRIEKGTVVFEFEIHKHKDGKWGYLTTSKTLRENDVLELGSDHNKKPVQEKVGDLEINVTDGVGVVDRFG